MSVIMMTTYTGRRIDPWNMTSKDVDIVAIGHALSMLCRFGGHTNEFYSVAQHSTRVAQLVPKEYRLEALLHDATEGICQDLIRPLKHKLWKYKELEDYIWQQIAFKYGLPSEQSECVKKADNAVLKSEIRQFLNDPGRATELAHPYWENVEEVDEVSRTLPPKEAEAMFMMTYADAVAQRIQFLETGRVKCGRCDGGKCNPDCAFYPILSVSN